jgi:hypothetical protein
MESVASIPMIPEGIFRHDIGQVWPLIMFLQKFAVFLSDHGQIVVCDLFVAYIAQNLSSNIRIRH